MRQITEVTRRDIFALFLYGTDIEDLWSFAHIDYQCYGRLTELDFLKRIYDLKALPSYDSRFDNAEGDIWQHTINNNDYENGWIFEDERFGLLNGEDDVLLKFLCTVFHPAVRVEYGNWKRFLDEINELLRADGYELYPESKISGRDVFGWRKYDPNEISLFIPFSVRHEKEIKSRHLTQSISRSARSQIIALLEKYTSTYRETDETGWQYNISTSECVFRDISQFYQPKSYDTSGKYVETSDMKQFISKTAPFCVFDAIEFYAKYNVDNGFTAQVNALLNLNKIPYKLENGRIESIRDVSIAKQDISAIPEKGLRELLMEAESYYNQRNKQIAVEKLWDAFERLKTYYSPTLNKAQSASKIIDDMSGSNADFRSMYDTEFKTLTNIGNNFRIRHHETTKTDITDNRQYDYFYKRCLALVSVAILYLEGE